MGETGRGYAQAVPEFLLGDAPSKGMASVVFLEGCGALALEALPAVAGVDLGAGAGLSPSQQGNATLFRQVFDDGPDVVQSKVATLRQSGQVAWPPLIDGPRISSSRVPSSMACRLFSTEAVKGR